ncbi:hypothetical protein PRVXH_001596 [Proteinivorax hydrogeniformans]|uniref:Tetratricopeptide repeat protein n=1 Tax=Proteinivorax hydrogeniformans TaxID=1826727 RepID=A0AAU8HR50_9FIRM
MSILSKLFKSNKSDRSAKDTDILAKKHSGIEAGGEALELLVESERLEKAEEYENAIKLRQQALAEPNLNASFNHYKKLHTLLLKIKKNDDAWRLLNDVALKRPQDISKISDLRRKQ